ncbi:sulfite exporter TauE/SafE family protein [Candidatus Woesebacteria bacterium]|nr:sulfite exporter TauE/SafE family protein [Candidatus Woesebacteria bacterium]MBP9687265.1 sulfite exporter TauE/SafE family protein [Candidatus Woesebacteria bacterium]
MNTIWIALLTGLTAGGVSCLAVQGGLLASSLATVPDDKKNMGTLLFLGAKIVSYTLLGFLLGFFGASLSISSTVQGWLQIMAGLYMIATAANLLQIHPIFRYVVVQPPTWAFKLLKTESQRKLFGPMILGVLTVFVPCGVTQGMMILAIGSGNAITGALLLLAFTLGTSPLFLLLGFSSSEIMKRPLFVYLASFFILLLGINSISAGNALRGSTHTLQNYYQAMREVTGGTTPQGHTVANVVNGVQEVDMTVTATAYKTTTTTLRVNVPVKLTLTSVDAGGCVQVFTIPQMNIKKLLPINGKEVITFTPTKTGILPFSCAMGMYTGQFEVI